MSVAPDLGDVPLLGAWHMNGYDERVTSRSGQCIHLDPAPISARLARAFVRQCLADRVDLDLDVVTLLVSELVINAVVHTGSPFDVLVSASTDVVEVSVLDQSPALPVKRIAEPGDENGRGLMMVERFADEWGVHGHDGGKRTWFKLGPHG